MGRTVLAGERTLLEVRGLSKSYLEGGVHHVVVRDLRLDIVRGEIVALLGRSGSGKTTLLNLISGIDVPDAGTIHIAGQCISALSEHERTLFRRNHLGFVFQFFNLIPTLTVRENLLLPLELLHGHLDARSRERADGLLERVGLEKRADAYPDRLSGGEQQRVAVARAVIHAPKLLLADEPTGNLDEDTGRAVMALLDELVRQSDTTLLMVTHSQDIARSADRVLRMRDGQLQDVTARVSGRRAEDPT